MFWMFHRCTGSIIPTEHVANCPFTVLFQLSEPCYRFRAPSAQSFQPRATKGQKTQIMCTVAHEELMTAASYHVEAVKA